jgi:hypothetical protein
LVYRKRERFCAEYNLILTKKYICYSGDDETTSPLDQYYLEDLAMVVRNLNAKGENLGIIYRKCPVDTTTRYDELWKSTKIVSQFWIHMETFGKSGTKFCRPKLI